MKPGGGRAKGIKFEQDIARQMREDCGFEDAMTSRAGDREKDSQGIDLINTEPFAIQCKRYAKYAPATCLEEVKLQEGYEIPILLTKADRAKTLAILPWEDLKLLIRQSFP